MKKFISHLSPSSLILQSLVLVIVAGFAYLPSYPGAFIWDDFSLIVENPLVTTPNGIWDIWFTTQANDYYPIANSIYWLLWQLFPNTPSAFLVCNIVLHGLTVLALFLFIRALLPGIAFWVSLLFAIHPLNTFSVCWISEIKNTSSALFFFLSLYFYLRFILRQKPWQFYALSLFLFILSLLSKPAGIMLPFILVGLTYWKDKASIRSYLVTLPFFLFSLLAGLTTIWFQSNRALDAIPLTASFSERCIIAGKSLVFYLLLAFNPQQIDVFYRKWSFVPGFGAYIPFAAFTIVLFLCIALFLRKRFIPVCFGVLFFVLTLLPVLGFINQGHYAFSFVANHWMYVPVVGLLIASLSIIHPLNSTIRIPLLWLVFALFFTSSWQQSKAFASRKGYYTAALQHYPESVIANQNLGNLAYEAGDFEQAINHFKMALTTEPELWDAHNKLAQSLLKLNQPEQAYTHAMQSLRLETNNPEALCLLGQLHGKARDYSNSIKFYRQALNFQPDNETIYGNLGVSYFGIGDITNSYKSLTQALQLSPDYTFARKNLEILLRTHPHLMQQTE